MDASARPRGVRIVLLGPPGSGKGTQGVRVARRLGVPAVSTGELLRRAIAAGSPLGKRVETIVARGGLVDDDTMLELVRIRLSADDAVHGVVLDGHPRTVPQAEQLDALLAADARRLDAAVSICVPEAALVQRLAARGRNDDRPEIIRERLRVYRESTAPLIAYYRRRRLLHEVDGDGAVETVTAAILARFEQAGAAA